MTDHPAPATETSKQESDQGVEKLRSEGLKALARMIARTLSDRNMGRLHEPEPFPADCKRTTGGGVYPKGEAKQSTTESQTPTRHGRKAPVDESE